MRGGRGNPVRQTSFAEFLELEAKSEVRHEFADGFVFAMAGGTDNHNRIARNILVYISPAAEETGCEPFISDMLVRTPDDHGYYPDVFVTCEERNDGSRVKRQPCFVVEVLSDSTEAIDRGEKLHHYQRIPALQAYVLVSQYKQMVEVYRRLPDGWRYEILESGVLELPCIGLGLPLERVYGGVGFEAGTP